MTLVFIGYVCTTCAAIEPCFADTTTMRDSLRAYVWTFTVMGDDASLANEADRLTEDVERAFSKTECVTVVERAQITEVLRHWEMEKQFRGESELPPDAEDKLRLAGATAVVFGRLEDFPTVGKTKVDIRLMDFSTELVASTDSTVLRSKLFDPDSSQSIMEVLARNLCDEISRRTEAERITLKLLFEQGTIQTRELDETISDLQRNENIEEVELSEANEQHWTYVIRYRSAASVSLRELIYDGLEEGGFTTELRTAAGDSVSMAVRSVSIKRHRMLLACAIGSTVVAGMSTLESNRYHARGIASTDLEEFRLNRNKMKDWQLGAYAAGATSVVLLVAYLVTGSDENQADSVLSYWDISPSGIRCGDLNVAIAIPF